MTEWSVAWSSSAQRSLQILPEKVAVAVIEFVYGPLAASPERLGKPLRYELQGLHVARRGVYRVVYELDDDQRTIVIRMIEHRGEVYRAR